MAVEAPNPQDDVAAGAAEALAPAKTSLVSRLMVLGFVLVVVGAECSVAYLCLPSAAETAAMAGATVGSKGPAEMPVEDNPLKEEKDEAAAEIEVDLGKFSVTAFQPTSNTALRIDFHLYGTVAAKDEKEFQKRMEANLHRFRDQVLEIVRSAEINDLTDAGLGLVKRKIMEKTNRTFGKPLLRQVIFSDFSFIEQ
jgi:flagellar FliL protein